MLSFSNLIECRGLKLWETVIFGLFTNRFLTYSLRIIIYHQNFGKRFMFLAFLPQVWV